MNDLIVLIFGMFSVCCHARLEPGLKIHSAIVLILQDYYYYQIRKAKLQLIPNPFKSPRHTSQHMTTTTMGTSHTLRKYVGNI